MKRLTIGTVLIAVMLFAGNGFCSVKTFYYDDLHRLERIEYDNGSAIEYTYDDAGNRETLTTSGPTPEPNLVATPASLDFGTVTVGSTSYPQTVTILNNGLADLHVGTITIEGEYGTEYQMDSGSCSGATLSKGVSCTVDVTFSPTSEGYKGYTHLRIPSDDPDSPTTIIPLDGLGAESTPGVISVSPISLEFGEVYVHTCSVEQTVTVSNTGGSSFWVGQITLEGEYGPWFQITDEDCSETTIPPGESRSIHTLFHPLGVDDANAELHIPNSTESPEIVVVSLGGTGITSTMSVSPSWVDFGYVDVGSASDSQAITVVNNGTSDLWINSTDIEGADATEFSHSISCFNEPVVPSGNCRIYVTFSPTSFGTKSATLNISSNNPDTPLVSVNLGGQGFLPAQIQVVPASLDFGQVSVGSISSPRTVIVSNVGGEDLVLGTVTINGTNATEFTNTGGSAQLSPGSSCNVTVAFAPQSEGAKTASLNIPSNDQDTPTAVVGLSGQGMAYPSILADPISLDFGTIPPGTTSDTLTVTVSNMGTSALILGEVTLQGTDAAEFTVITNTCLSSEPLDLDPGEACSVSVAFQPQTPGAKNALLRFPSNDPDTPILDLPLQGNQQDQGFQWLVPIIMLLLN